MKTRYLTIAVFFVCLLIGVSVTAQTYVEEDDSVQQEQILEGENLNPTVLANLGISTAPNPRAQNIQGNSVFLTQAGEFNQATVRTATESSDISIAQNGDFNLASLTYTANSVFADIQQNGDFNTVTDFVNNGQVDVSLELTQEGNGLNFQREGVNGLTKSIKFRQTEASPSIIVRSFN